MRQSVGPTRHTEALGLSQSSKAFFYVDRTTLWSSNPLSGRRESAPSEGPVGPFTTNSLAADDQAGSTEDVRAGAGTSGGDWNRSYLDRRRTMRVRSSEGGLSPMKSATAAMISSNTS